MSQVKMKLIGFDKLKQQIKKMPHNVAVGVRADMKKTADEIMVVSQTLVPVVTGKLKASGFVRKINNKGGIIFLNMGYSAPYALSVHENPRAGKTKYGSQVGQWKYLEQPFRQFSRNLNRRIKRRIANIALGRF